MKIFIFRSLRSFICKLVLLNLSIINGDYMKTRSLVLSLLLVASTTVFASTEISKADAQKYKEIGQATVTERTVTTCTSALAKKADKLGAAYYVIESMAPSGGGDNITFSGKFYN